MKKKNVDIYYDDNSIIRIIRGVVKSTKLSINTEQREHMWINDDSIFLHHPPSNHHTDLYLLYTSSRNLCSQYPSEQCQKTFHIALWLRLVQHLPWFTKHWHIILTYAQNILSERGYGISKWRIVRDVRLMIAKLPPKLRFIKHALTNLEQLTNTESLRYQRTPARTLTSSNSHAGCCFPSALQAFKGKLDD